jgi:hypothetical protein
LDNSREEVIAVAVKNMNILLKASEEYGVIFAIETHDEWVDTTTIKEFLETITTTTRGYYII